MNPSSLNRAFVVCAVHACLLNAGYSQVMLDGSLGPGGPLAGPDYQIGADLGRQIGPNLFHSFSEFNLVNGDVANFSGPAEIGNILARVTGGNASSIDGTLRSDVTGANLFLINPAGVMFGQNASLDISGSFVVTTADYLRLADGGRFEALEPSASLLSAAPPDAFGFLDNAINAIELNRAQLQLTDGQSVSLVGGEVSMGLLSRLTAPAGRVAITSVGSAGEVEGIFDPEPTSAALGGTVTLGALSSINTGAAQADQSGGAVLIRAGRLVMEDAATIRSHTSGSADGGEVSIQAAEEILLTEAGRILTSTSGAGNGGNIRLSAPTVRLDGGASQVAQVDSTISGPEATGRGGTITVQADRLECFRGGLFSTLTSSPGAGGDIEVQAREIVFDGEDIFLTGLVAETDTDSGPVGSISVTTERLEIGPGGIITATTFGPGQGGTISIHANQIILDARGNEADPAAIVAQVGGDGPGGAIQIETETLDLLAGGQISTSTFGSGNGGRLDIQAQRISMDGLGTGIPTGLASQTESEGGGGNIAIDTGELIIADGAGISTSTFGPGDAGNISILANETLIAGQGIQTFTGIAATAEPGSSGNGGNVSLESETVTIIDVGHILTTTAGFGSGGNILLDAESLSLDRGGFISAETFSSGHAGNIEVAADEIDLNQGGLITATTLGSGDGGSVSIRAAMIHMDDLGMGLRTGIEARALDFFGDGRAGDVSVSAEVLRMFEGASISTITIGPKSAGNIDVSAGEILLDGRGTDTRISASTFSEGAGGDISLEVERLNLRDGGNLTTATLAEGNAGNIAITGPNGGLAEAILLDGALAPAAIQATSGFSSGQGGNITIGSAGIEVVNEGSIVASTQGAGQGGNISITANRFRLDQGSLLSASTGFGSGQGGTIRVDGGASVSLANGSSISSGTLGEGLAGTIIFDISSLSLDGSATVESGSLGSGSAGSLQIDASGSVSLRDQSLLSTSSFFSDGGDITVTAGRSIELRSSSISAQAALDGGNVHLQAPRLVYLFGSQITAEAGNNGGNITIDPTFVVLDHSLINANAIFGNGGNINIISDFFLQNDSVITASSEFGFAGSVDITAPDVDLSGSLTPLAVVLLSGASQLPEHCARMVPGDVSSFIVLGRGGLPIVPGGWLPSFGATPPRKEKQADGW